MCPHIAQQGFTIEPSEIESFDLIELMKVRVTAITKGNIWAQENTNIYWLLLLLKGRKGREGKKGTNSGLGF